VFIPPVIEIFPPTDDAALGVRAAILHISSFFSFLPFFSTPLRFVLFENSVFTTRG